MSLHQPRTRPAPSAASRAHFRVVPDAIRQDAESLRPGEWEGTSRYETYREDPIEHKQRQCYARRRRARLLPKAAPASVAMATAPVELAPPEGAA